MPTPATAATRPQRPAPARPMGERKGPRGPRAPGGGPRRAWGLLAFMLVISFAIGQAFAQSDRTAYFVNLLNTSSSFRVRAQAALALGRVDTSPEVRRALTTALSDSEPAVRAAAASAMERLGDRELLGALRAASGRERDATVRSAEERAIAALSRTPDSSTDRPEPSGPARYYVAIGSPGDRSSAFSAEQIRTLRGFITETVGGLEGVRMAPDGESNAAATRALRRNRLVGYYVETSIVQVDESGGGVSARVSVILATYPSRDMRAMLSGSARVPGGTGDRAKLRATQGALQGALRQLPQAMRASEARASR